MTAPASAQISSTSWWPKFQRDTRNTGSAPVDGFIADPHVLWSVRLSAPIAAENHATPAFSPDNTRMYVGGPNSTLSAISLVERRVVWSLRLGDGTGSILHTAVVATDGSIYVGSWDNSTPYDGFCKIRDNGASGSIVWTFPLRRALASPTITPAGTIVIGGRPAVGNSAYFALRDDGASYTLLWTAAQLGNPADPLSTGNVGASPALSPDGQWVYGGSDANQRFWKLNAATGAEFARVPLTQYVWAAAPVVAETGHIFIGEGMSFTAPNDGSEGKLYCFRPETQGASGVLESLALAAGHLNGGTAALARGFDGVMHLYVPANGQGKPDAKLIALSFDPSGPTASPPRPALTRRWTVGLGDSAVAYPQAVVTRDGIVLTIGPKNHTLYAVRDAGAAGRLLWSLSLATISRVAGWTVANQRGPQGVVVGPDATIYWNAPDGYLYAIGGATTGDLDGDGRLTPDDLAWLRIAVGDRAQYDLLFPELSADVLADIDGSGSVDSADIERLSALLGQL